MKPVKWGSRLEAFWGRSNGCGIVSVLLALSLGGTGGPCSAQSAQTQTGESPAIEKVLETFEIGAVEARTGALLLSGQMGGNVDGELTWSLGGRNDDGEATVPFVVEVEGRSLIAGETGRNIAIGFYAYVVDDDGRVIDHMAEGVVLPAEEYAAGLRAAGLKFAGEFSLRPGDYALRVMVRNQRAGTFFMSWRLITVPGDDDHAARLLPPLFPDSASHWTVVRQPGLASSAFIAGQPGFLPSAKPVLLENNAAEVWLGGGEWSQESRVEIRVINSIGRTVAEPVVGFSGDPSGDFEMRPAEIAPIDLPPGEYTLIVTVTDEQTSEVLRRALPFVVAAGGQLPVWAASAQHPPSTSPGGDSGEEGGKKVKKAEIRKSYRRALTALADGDSVEAKGLVAEIERRVDAEPSRKAVDKLSEAEYAEAKALAHENPQSLIPLALLHRELYQSYMARNEGPLAFHARQMALTYAEMLARLAPENGFSEALMVNLAADLAQSGAASAARDLLEATVRLSPGYRPALLSLGFSFERKGEYFEATVAYRRLVESSPTFDEGRLRLGINLIRIGRGDAGSDLLREILSTGETPWVQSVAAQELVRFLIEKRSLEEAERAARSAVEWMPQDQRLRILLAAILEQSTRHGESFEVAAALPPAGRGVSPRARYSEWPSLGVGASHASLSARAVAALPDLESALGGSGGGR